jgi:hypothetical protein
MTPALQYLDAPKKAEKQAIRKDRRKGGLRSYLPRDFKLPDEWWQLPEADGDPGLADK